MPQAANVGSARCAAAQAHRHERDAPPPQAPVSYRDDVAQYLPAAPMRLRVEEEKGQDGLRAVERCASDERPLLPGAAVVLSTTDRQLGPTKRSSDSKTRLPASSPKRMLSKCGMQMRSAVWATVNCATDTGATICWRRTEPKKADGLGAGETDAKQHLC